MKHIHTITLLCAVNIDSSVSSSDKIIIATSVEALSEQNSMSYNEIVDLCLANGRSKKKLLEDKLETFCPGT